MSTYVKFKKFKFELTGSTTRNFINELRSVCGALVTPPTHTHNLVQVSYYLIMGVRYS